MYTATILFLYATGMIAHSTIVRRSSCFVNGRLIWKLISFGLWPIVILAAFIVAGYQTISDAYERRMDRGIQRVLSRPYSR